MISGEWMEEEGVGSEVEEAKFEIHLLDSHQQRHLQTKVSILIVDSKIILVEEKIITVITILLITKKYHWLLIPIASQPCYLILEYLKHSGRWPN
jgi:hypothetical protein